MAELTPAYIGLGSNLNDPVRQVKTALAELGALPGCRLEAASRLYRNPPMGPADQPDYVNAVACLNTRLTPRALLEALQGIERAHGRVRGPERWGPRSLDLDLLLYGQAVIREPDLVVPHPGLHERPFVLYPLREIAPQLEIPGLGTLQALCSRCASQGLIALDELP